VTENKEIKALLLLLDDPDETVFKMVGDRIVSIGKQIIPNLEQVWETVPNEDLQERIEMLIHRVHFRDLTEEMVAWKASADQDLIKAALLVARYQYPDLAVAETLQFIEKIKRNIWLELNNYLTPLEQINVFNSILFNYFKLAGQEIDYEHPDQFLIHKALESKKGNSIINSVIYQALCELLDIPVYAVRIPKQFLLAYLNTNPALPGSKRHGSDNISFYIDPLNGQMYSHKDVENYFKRMSVPPVSYHFKPMHHDEIILRLIEEFAKCFDNDNNRYKMKELQSLADILTQ
jgi:regulator of sirC expression with transglutaminase-like and TPR domain